MRDTFTFLAAMFALTALVEFVVLRRCVGHRRYAFCVLSVSFVSGVVWMASAMTLFHIRWGWKAAHEPPMSASEWVIVSLFVVLDVVLLSIAALIPAGTVALIHRRLRKPE